MNKATVPGYGVGMKTSDQAGLPVGKSGSSFEVNSKNTFLDHGEVPITGAKGEV